ncbi:MAG: glycosyltransferase [Fimbriimonadaceae bacterium]|nr:MAG: glycosyltransferase [Fimbriimonadaceae bacterium]
MTQFSRIVFWQNMASHHQALVLSELAKVHNFQIVWVVEEPLSKDRSAMGWPELEDGSIELVVRPDEARVKELVSDQPEKTLHIFGGLFNLPSSKLGIKYALKLGVPLGLMREAPVPPGFHEVDGVSKLKRIPFLHTLAHKFVMLKLRRRFILGLCIGDQSRKWISKIGYPTNALFPWAYFPPPPASQVSFKRSSSKFKITYLGVVSHTKGTDILFQALCTLKDLDWEFNCIGQGPDLEKCKEIARTGGIEDRITYEPFKPYNEAMSSIATTDLVVAPSRHDGWNAVVSEAIMRGTRVVVSDAAGASSLITKDHLGSVFPSENIQALADQIAAQISKGPAKAAERKKTMLWSKSIQPTAAAYYLTQIIRYLGDGTNRPTAPWE